MIITICEKGDDNLNDELRNTVMRKRGELNLNTKELAEITGVSQWTLSAFFRGTRTNLHKSTINKLNNWLYKQL